MQTVGGAIVADISGDARLVEPRVERFEIGALMDKAAFDSGGEKPGMRARHGAVI